MKPRAYAVTLFPEKPKAPKGPKKGFSVRLASDVVEYLGEVMRKGYGRTEAIESLTRMARDVEREIGAALEQIEGRAKEEGLSVGRMIGRLAVERLASRKKQQTSKK